MRAIFVSLIFTICWLNIGNVFATVDPDNATRLITEDGTQFNVTHFYWRDRIQAKPDSLLAVWVNPYELPESIQYYHNGKWSVSKNVDFIYGRVLKIAMTALADWNVLKPKRIFFRDYYRKLALESDFIHKQPLNPLHLRFNPREVEAYGFPLQIHFRHKPYPQSSFGEFVSNRAVSWRVWLDYNRDYAQSEFVGADDDLLYRMRHNLGHSLGLGHTTLRECIMYPTNVRGLRTLCPAEQRAMARLLSSRPLIAPQSRQRRYNIRRSPDRRECLYMDEVLHCVPAEQRYNYNGISEPYDVRPHETHGNCLYINGQLFCSL
nr:matrixin [Apis mellifera nudivirus]